ncbi:GNAT family N-acetyltransferase [Psychrobacter urativorans]|uniref:GNAT family N-acetyltransferase n=1 Tax=Psychrobacter urativorans TaxID=45610 RepID=UPI0019195E5D|nr:GNAT family N-acetyltransferase [Psychrobacter urativorans]
MSSTTTQNAKKPSSPSVAWQLSTFAELSAYQIYNIIQAREQVFVKDQHCVYIDADGLDFDAIHLSAYNHDINANAHDYNKPQLLAYCRILAPITAQSHSHTNYPRIGRVLVSADYRGHGLARELMLRAIDYCHIHFPKQPIHISAQTYLIEFYQSLGFICEGGAFDEEGIEHIHMILANFSI